MSHWVGRRHSTHLPSAGLQTGLPPSQSVSAAQSTQAPVVVLQTWLPSQSPVSAHWTQDIVTGSQMLALPPLQSTSFAQAGPQLWFAGEHTSGAVQSAFVAHS